MRDASNSGCHVRQWPIATDRILVAERRFRGITDSFDTFVTNVFENQRGQWLLVAHQATPVFGTPK
jgi:hypothetical protein